VKNSINTSKTNSSMCGSQAEFAIGSLTISKEDQLVQTLENDSAL